MELELILTSPLLRDETVTTLTRDLARTLEREPEINVEIPTRPPSEGSKGEPITIGLLLLTFISSGAAVALLNVLKSYVERERSLRIILKKADGTHVEVDAKNLNEEQERRILEQLLPRDV